MDIFLVSLCIGRNIGISYALLSFAIGILSARHWSIREVDVVNDSALIAIIPEVSTSHSVSIENFQIVVISFFDSNEKVWIDI